MDKYCLHLSVAMFIECIWLHNKQYENFEGNKIRSLGLQGKLVKMSIGWFFVFNSLKFCSLKCRSHVQIFFLKNQIIHMNLLKHFLIFEFEPKFICTLMYTCEKSSSPNELFYFGLFLKNHLNFSCVNVICRN
jgi:hypothetical protein